MMIKVHWWWPMKRTVFYAADLFILAGLIFFHVLYHTQHNRAILMHSEAVQASGIIIFLLSVVFHLASYILMCVSENISSLPWIGKIWSMGVYKNIEMTLQDQIKGPCRHCAISKHGHKTLPSLWAFHCLLVLGWLLSGEELSTECIFGKTCESGYFLCPLLSYSSSICSFYFRDVRRFCFLQSFSEKHVKLYFFFLEQIIVNVISVFLHAVEWIA